MTLYIATDAEDPGVEAFRELRQHIKLTIASVIADTYPGDVDHKLAAAGALMQLAASLLNETAQIDKKAIKDFMRRQGGTFIKTTRDNTLFH